MRVATFIFFFIPIVASWPARPINSTVETQDSVKYPYEEAPTEIRHLIGEPAKQVKKEKAIVTIEEEHFPTLDELRLKCQHFSRLFGLGGSSTPDGVEEIEIHSTPTYNRPLIEVTRRPVFIRNKPTFAAKNTNGGFYVTSSSNDLSTTTHRPFWHSSTSLPRVQYQDPTQRTTTPTTTTTEATTKSNIKIKYTKFEPVILQKTILTDGRVMYHWHRSLPTSAIELPAPIAPVATPPVYEYPNAVSLSQRTGEVVEATESSTSTTTEKSSWLFVPFSSFFGGSHEEETTTAEPHTTPQWVYSSTTPKVTTKSAQVYSTTEQKPAQLKLVVPIHYEDLDSSLAQNSRLGLYNRPNSLQVIKTLGVPQTVPRYGLGYNNNGYGLTNLYGQDYLNYQTVQN